MADVALAIEVDDPWYPGNVRMKVAEYGKAGIAETWLVDIAARRVEVYRGPGRGGEAGAYDEPALYGAEDEVPFRPALDPGGPGRSYPAVSVRAILD